MLLLVGVVLGLLLIVYVLIFPDAASEVGKTSPVLGAVLMVVSTLLFVVRDVALILWLNLSSKAKRADAAATTYLLVLYLIVPWLVIGLTNASASFLFFPLLDIPKTSMSAFYLLSPLLQAMLMVGLLTVNWKDRFERGEQ